MSYNPGSPVRVFYSSLEQQETGHIIHKMDPTSNVSHDEMKPAAVSPSSLRTLDEGATPMFSSQFVGAPAVTKFVNTRRLGVGQTPGAIETKP